jgi:tripartite-type tricarboxylate transporter receptor subunit TctC
MGHTTGLRFTLSTLVTLMVVAGLTLPGGVQGGTFPEKGRAITLINAYPAGGGSDVTHRMLAVILEKELGTPVQVVNKPGAGGQVGYTELARSRPDGYTIGGLNLPTVITTYFDSSRQAVFSRKSFDYLAMQDIDPGLIAVKADSPYKTLKDLIDAARANPGKIRTTTAGILSDDHIAAMKTERIAGVKFAIVHFDGSAPGRTAVAGGHVEAYYGNVTDIQPVAASGQLRILAVMDPQRVKFFPEVKTAEEQGYKIYSGVHRGVAMPAGAPKEVRDVLIEALRKSITSEEYRTRMEKLWCLAVYMSPQEYVKFWTEYEVQAKQWVEWAAEQK